MASHSEDLKALARQVEQSYQNWLRNPRSSDHEETYKTLKSLLEAAIDKLQDELNHR